MRACIVTCGGLCPGLNTVIREIVCGLSHMYGVQEILGIVVSWHSLWFMHAYMVAQFPWYPNIIPCLPDILLRN